MLVLSFALKTADRIYYLFFAVLLLGVGIFFGIAKKKSGVIISTLLILLFCVRIICVLTDLSYKSVKYDGISENIVAVVADTPDSNTTDDNYGNCVAVIKETENDLLSYGDKILVVGEGVANLSLGDKISAEVRLEAIDKKSLGSLSFYGENIFLRAKTISPIVANDNSKGIYYFSFKVREYVKNTFAKYADNYGMILAVLTGERNYIGDVFYDKVKVAGVSHILVVSGMHFVVLCGVLLKLLSVIRLSDTVKDIILLLFIFLMACVCGFSMSILRAGMVFVFDIIYRRTNRIGDSIHSLANALIVVLFIHPFAVFSVVFLLSFSSTFGIIVLPKQINKRLYRKNKPPKVVRFIIDTAVVSLSALIFTLPVIIYYFGYISTYSVLANVLVAPASNLMLIFSAVGALLGGIPFLSGILVRIADLLSDYFICVVEMINKLPFNTIPIKNTNILTLIILIIYFAIYVISQRLYLFLLKKR